MTKKDIKRVLIVHQQLFGVERVGGAEAVFAYTVQALKDSCEIYVAVPFVGKFLQNPRLINDIYGTNIKPKDFNIINLPLWNIVKPILNKSWFLHTFFFMLFIRFISKNFDICISTYNEFDFGSCANTYQYLHYPMLYETLNGRLRKLLAKMLGFSYYRVLSNHSFTCSRHTANIIKQAYTDINVEVIYPPVKKINVINNKDARDNKEIKFIYIGRISPEKRIEYSIDIINGVRKYVKNVTLTIAGPVYDSKYKSFIERKISNKRWVRAIFKHVNSREMNELLRIHDFGINSTKEEQFGIVIAEMIRSGILVFVHNSGGQTEIVPEDLKFDNKQDAIIKIVSILKNPRKQNKLLKKSMKYAKKFSAKNFMINIKGAILKEVK